MNICGRLNLVWQARVLSCRRNVSVMTYTFPMPSLSPEMKNATIDKWHIQEGQRVEMYGLVLDVSTNSLTAHSDDRSRLEIELQEEDLFVCKILQPEGSIVKPGDPLVIFGDSEQCLLSDSPLVVSKNALAWQAYVKSKTDPGSVGCS